MTKLLAAGALFTTLLVGPAVTGTCGGSVFAQVGMLQGLQEGQGLRRQLHRRGEGLPPGQGLRLRRLKPGR